MIDYGQLVVAIAAAVIGVTLGVIAGKPFGRFQGVVAALVIVVAMSAAMYRPLTDWTNIRLGFATRHDMLIRDKGEALLDNRTIRKLIMGASAAQAAEVAGDLTARGVQYLDREDLATWARIMLMLAKRSEVLCAAMWNGGGDPAVFYEVLHSLPEADATAWARIETTAAIRAAEADAAAEGASAYTYDAALAEILERLPPEQRAGVEADLGNVVGDARACELLTTVLEGSFELAPDLRDGFWRGFYALE